MGKKAPPEQLHLPIKVGNGACEARPKCPIVSFYLAIGAMLIGLSACTGFRQVYPTDVFIPPTRLPTILPPSAAPINPAIATVAFTPTPEIACNANLTFLSDLTLPDGSPVEPGEMLDKRWQVQNSGDCNWDVHYRLKLVAGSAMDAPDEQPLYPARGGSEALIRILFKAPKESGEYRSAWQAYGPDGKPFGDPVYLVIVVP
jgi:hypothetical protein